MARVRIGPLSYGPRGRQGVHVGPFSASWNANNPVLVAFILIAVAWAIIRAIWPFLLGALALIFVLVVVTAKDRERRTEEAVQRQKEEVRRWLAGPPPVLMVPSRFSDKWFAVNVPRLHPGQVTPLLAEMRARGWSDQRIAQRVGPYLRMNPFLARSPQEIHK